MDQGGARHALSICWYNPDSDDSYVNGFTLRLVLENGPVEKANPHSNGGVL